MDGAKASPPTAAAANGTPAVPAEPEDPEKKAKKVCTILPPLLSGYGHAQKRVLPRCSLLQSLGQMVETRFITLTQSGAQ